MSSILPPDQRYWLNIAQPDTPALPGPFARIAAEHNRLIKEARMQALREAMDIIRNSDNIEQAQDTLSGVLIDLGAPEPAPTGKTNK
jgi:hypothetical protein